MTSDTVIAIAFGPASPRDICVSATRCVTRRREYPRPGKRLDIVLILVGGPARPRGGERKRRDEERRHEDLDVAEVVLEHPGREDGGHRTDGAQRHAAQRLPARGEIGIFNRSHYEEVLVVRVHPELLERQNLPKDARGKDVWQRRYREINDWERYLTGNGIKLVKIFLNLSQEEQRVRFLRRLDLPDHSWKFSASDARERQYWDDYQDAFSEMLSHTSTEWAPWYVVPADRKWFARICVSSLLAQTLIELDPKYPHVSSVQRREERHAKAELLAQAPKGADADPFDATHGKA